MTAKKKPRVYITRKLPDVVETRMRELFDAELNIDDAPRSQPELVAAVKRADVLVPTLTDRIDAALIEQAGPQLKLIASFSNGVDHIDVDAAARRGITVTNTPNVLTDDTADMTMALILAAPRRLIEGANILTDRRGEWAGWSPTWMLGRRLGGKRIGIVGMGRIGTAVALRAKAFGLSIHYHNRKRVSRETEEKLEATYWDSLDQMLARVDIVSVNCPSTPPRSPSVCPTRAFWLLSEADRRPAVAETSDSAELSLGRPLATSSRSPWESSRAWDAMELSNSEVLFSESRVALVSLLRESSSPNTARF